MTGAETVDRVDAFRGLHADGPFVLPCAWDVPSARLIGRLPGVRAIGTTSAGIAATHGQPDGERIALPAMLAAVSAIVRATGLSVSADLGSGAQSSLDAAAALPYPALAELLAGIPSPEKG